MKKVIFVCHGNICRSPMALFVCQSLINDNPKLKDYCFISRATSYEEEGNGLYYEARKTLENHHIKIGSHTAKRITYEEASDADYILIMEEYNRHNLERIIPKYMDKVKLISFCYDNKEIEDPWYTRNFEKVYQQIYYSVLEFLNFLTRN